MKLEISIFLATITALFLFAAPALACDQDGGNCSGGNDGRDGGREAPIDQDPIDQDPVYSDPDDPYCPDDMNGRAFGDPDCE